MANDDHIAQLMKGVDAWNAWREENRDIRPGLDAAILGGTSLDGANLSGANLPRADLSEASLCEANLSEANLSRADLGGASLRKANLSEANLGEANLSRADLHRTNLTGASLRKANLTEANLRRADLSEDIRGGPADLSGADLRRANLSEADLIEVNLSEANLSGANLSGANLSGANFSEANLWKANLSEAYIRITIRRRDVNLNRANLKEANLDEAIFIDADLSGADLRGADLEHATLTHTDLTGADLTGCRVYGSSAWDLKLEGAKQQSLVITPADQTAVMVDDLEVAQFIYLLLNREKIRNVIDAVTRRGVLILGRFADGGLSLLQAVAAWLRTPENGAYLPLLFDFPRPESKTYMETVRTLASLARFVIVDLSGPSVPQEITATVDLYEIPFVPILEQKRKDWSMFKDFLVKERVLSPVRFIDQGDLLQLLAKEVIAPAEKLIEKRQQRLDEIFGRS
jgi:uncharacterized protein YjbI with pentapeptide repeats